MWFSIQTLLDSIKVLKDTRSRFLILSLLEQGLSDLAIANRVDSRNRFRSLRERIRELNIELAMKLLNGREFEIGGKLHRLADEVSQIQFYPRNKEYKILEACSGRRKWWPAIPECLGVHFTSLDDIIEEVKKKEDDLISEKSQLLVVGVRTSGSILAPLVAALVRNAGGISHYLTVRLCIDRSSPEAANLDLDLIGDEDIQEVLKQHSGRICVVDDPPTTGLTSNKVINFIRRYTSEQQITFLPVGVRDSAFPIYEERLIKMISSGESVRQLPRRKPSRSLYRKTWAIGCNRRVYKPYGEPFFAMLEQANLKRLFPVLDYSVNDVFITMRMVDLPNSPSVSELLEDRHIISLAEFLSEYRILFAVDWISPALWQRINMHRLGRNDMAWPEDIFADSINNLVRCNMGLEWWHYGFQENGRFIKIHGEIGHWSTVVDIAEIIASIIIELNLSSQQSTQLISSYRDCSGDCTVVNRLGIACELYIKHIERQIEEQNSNTQLCRKWKNDRHRVLSHGRRILERKAWRC